jgi:quinol monooxygenase YgiN
MYAWDRKRYDDVIGLPGCDQYEIFQGAVNPDLVYVLENWETRGAFHSGWKIISVQVPVGAELLAEETDQPHSGFATEIYWELNEIDEGATLPAGGGRLVLNANTKPGERDAYAEAWKAANASSGAELLLGTRNHDNIAELGTWSDGAALADYLKSRNALVAHLGSADERMSGSDGIELYAAPAYYRWNGSEWVEAAVASRS